MNKQVLQASQFFRERVARAEAYDKHHHNGHSDSDEAEDEGTDHDEVREVEAHKNVFQRP